jgi:hypothetical protein
MTRTRGTTYKYPRQSLQLFATLVRTLVRANRSGAYRALPISSVAMAQRDGKSLNEKVLGTAPPPKPLPVPGQSGWPPRPTGRDDRGRGRGRPPSGKLTVGAEGGPAPEADAATSQRSNVTLQEKAAQLERELQQLKQQMAGRSRGRARGLHTTPRGRRVRGHLGAEAHRTHAARRH